ARAAARGRWGGGWRGGAPHLGFFPPGGPAWGEDTGRGATPPLVSSPSLGGKRPPPRHPPCFPRVGSRFRRKRGRVATWVATIPGGAATPPYCPRLVWVGGVATIPGGPPPTRVINV